MSPRTGRPPKNGKSKNVSLQLRITEDTANQLLELSKNLNISRTEVIEKAVNLLYKYTNK